METKKTQKASLENKRFIFLEVGLILSLLAVISAFSFTTAARKAPVLTAGPQDVAEVEIIPITQETPPEPPKVPAIPVLSDILQIVDEPIENDTFINFEETDVEVPLYEYRPEVEEEEIDEDIPYVLVSKKPLFQGEDASTFSRWVAKNLVYPEIAKEMNLSGRVTLEFTVRKDGKITDIVVKRGVDPILDKEAVRVVSNSPRWEPGMQQDRAVNVRYTFPVIFRLK